MTSNGGHVVNLFLPTKFRPEVEHNPNKKLKSKKVFSRGTKRKRASRKKAK